MSRYSFRGINSRILFFDCAFDIMEECSEEHKAISWGLVDAKLSCYLDETLFIAKKDTLKKLKER